MGALAECHVCLPLKLFTALDESQLVLSDFLRPSILLLASLSECEVMRAPPSQYEDDRPRRQA